jgi:uncharacterized protein DUF6371/zinc ribbon protein/uncharacterized protein DUF6965
MNTYRYILEPYKGMNTRYHCPGCQKREKTFSRYIDTQTGKYIDTSVGRCNRESNCGYHYTPKQYFQDNNISFNTSLPKLYSKPKAVTLQQPGSFIPLELFKASLQSYESNHLIMYLIYLFGIEVARNLISRYFIATSKYWKGATVFWQIDISGKVRTGKIMLYNPTSGKRVKEPFSHINWAHAVLKIPEFELRQCLFGEHLLRDKTKPVAIVESEKTAIIASVYFPQFIWLAVGSINNLKSEICKVLVGRTVILFPDLNGFKKWSDRAEELSHLANFNVSSLLESKAIEAERKQGFDLADYLAQFDYKEFVLSESTKQFSAVKLFVEKKKVESIDPIDGFIKAKKTKKPKVEDWNQDIADLEKFFSANKLPEDPVKLGQGLLITDVSLFVESHLAIVKEQNGNLGYAPYMDRLGELKLLLS